ncbi:hypothetical protein KTG15_12505 [Methanobacterium sp. YSL]|nr:hypothetical protein [Methanobacterium sp. YSL]
MSLDIQRMTIQIQQTKGMLMKKIVVWISMLVALGILYGCNQTKPIDFDQIQISGVSLTHNETTNIYETTDSISLPKTIQKQTITWTSSHPNVISITGVVTRPDESAQDVTVTLTAIVKGQEKTFTIRVIKHAPTIDLSAFYGDYMLYRQGSSKSNGLSNKQATPEYYYYRITISETGISEHIQYLNPLKPEVTNTYPLTVFKQNPFVSEYTGFSYYLDETMKYIEVSKVTAEGYEAVILNNRGEVGRFTENTQYRLALDLSHNPFNSLLPDLFGVSFYDTQLSYVSYHNALGSLTEMGFYEKSKNFIFVRSEYEFLYRIVDDTLLYQADYMYDKLSGIITKQAIEYTLIHDQLPEQAQLSFTNDTLLRTELNALFNSSNVTYAVSEMNLNGGVKNSLYIHNNQVLESNFYGDFFYSHIIDDNYMRYELNENKNQAVSIVMTSALFPFKETIQNIPGMVAKLDDAYYIKTTYGGLNVVTNAFNNNEASDEIILKISERNNLVYMDVYENHFFVGNLVFDFNSTEAFTLDDFDTTFSNYFYTDVKPLEINQRYTFESNQERDYYFKVELAPGAYVIEASHYYSFLNAQKEIIDIGAIKHPVRSGTMIQTDTNLTFYIHITQAYAFRQMYVEIFEMTTPQKASSEIAPNTVYTVPATNIFDEFEYTFTPTTNTAYKLVITGTEHPIVRIDSLEHDNYISRNDLEPLVIYLTALANTEIKLMFHTNSNFILYEAPKYDGDPILLSAGLDDRAFYSSTVYPKLTFEYTLTAAEFEFELYYFRNETSANDFEGSFEAYYRTDSGYVIYGPDGNLVTGKMTTPGTYTIELTSKPNFMTYKVNIIEKAPVDVTISMPFTTTHTLQPEYSAIYRFNVLEKSYFRIKMNQSELFRLIDDEDNRILWGITGDHVITLNPGVYRIEAIAQNSPIEYTLSVENKGASQGLAFDDTTIYTYPISITYNFMFTNELIRLEFEPQEYLYYSGVAFTVTGQFNPLGSTKVLNHQVWYKITEDTPNITNIYFVASSALGNQTIGFIKR